MKVVYDVEFDARQQKIRKIYHRREETLDEKSFQLGRQLRRLTAKYHGILHRYQFNFQFGYENAVVLQQQFQHITNCRTAHQGVTEYTMGIDVNGLAET